MNKALFHPRCDSPTRALSLTGSTACGNLQKPAEDASPRVRTALHLLRLLPLLLLAIVLSGCATAQRPPSARAFDFNRDTFAYANELVWEYGYDANGKWTSQKRVPKPSYSLHCFVVARSALQFFQNARFEPSAPPVDQATYRKLVRWVVHMNPRKPPEEAKKVVIPGYADLRSFSKAEEKLLKAQCGPAWQSYVQRGHWRMVFPFSRKYQEKTASALAKQLADNHPVVVHVSCFPSLAINHALLLFKAHEEPNQIDFEVYDPNSPEAPTRLVFDRVTRTFVLPTNKYFQGGPVDVYQVYHRWMY